MNIWNQKLFQERLISFPKYFKYWLLSDLSPHYEGILGITKPSIH